MTRRWTWRLTEEERIVKRFCRYHGIRRWWMVRHVEPGALDLMRYPERTGKAPSLDSQNP